MNRDQFLRKLKKYCRKNGLTYEWEPGEGKGSHGAAYVAGRRTIVQSGELQNYLVDDILDYFQIPRGSL